MRDIVLLAVILASLPVCFARPFFGGLVWTWVAFMNPHRLAWGMARNFPVAYLVALATLGGFLVSSEPKRLPRSAGTYALWALWVLLGASTLVAYLPDNALEAWTQRTKILLMLLVIVSMVNTHERLRVLLLVTALSVGFFGFKDGLFALMTGASYRVAGPDDTFLGDNNAIAVGFNMVLPLLYYLREDVADRRLRLLLLVTFLLSIPATIATYSRGGLLGLGAVAALMVLKSRHRFLGLILLAITAFGAVVLVPAEWSERMGTIETYDKDSSAMSRIYAWRVAWRLALARPLLGWGPNAMESVGGHNRLFDLYCPECPIRTGVHSSYFQVMAEGGFTTFFVYLGLFGWCLITLQRVRSRFARSEQHRWAAHYADMLQISLIGFSVSGAFLELAYFDLMLHIVGSTIVLKELVDNLVPVAVPRKVGFPARLAPLRNAARA
ncbi:MAG: putative O-glycosylation ligase, exosortase A system-associated [Candidatus Binatia bacterium]